MPFSPDTTPDARALVLSSLRRLSAPERLALWAELSSTLHELAHAGVLNDMRDASPQSQHREYLRRVLGPRLADEVIAARPGGAPLASPGHDVP